MVFNIYEQSCSFIDVSSVKANPSLFYNWSDAETNTTD